MAPCVSLMTWQLSPIQHAPAGLAQMFLPKPPSHGRRTNVPRLARLMLATASEQYRHRGRCSRSRRFAPQEEEGTGYSSLGRPGSFPAPCLPVQEYPSDYKSRIATPSSLCPFVPPSLLLRSLRTPNEPIGREVLPTETIPRYDCADRKPARLDTLESKP